MSKESSVTSKRKVMKVEREIPELNYEYMEGFLKNLQGQVLTVVETISGTKEQSNAAKSLIRSFFNQRLTWLFDLYGRECDQETPNYSEPDADGE